MKLPSIQRLLTELVKVLRLFPIEISFTLVASCAATALIELERNNLEYSNWCWRIMMASNAGLLLSLSATIFSKSRALKRSSRWLLLLLAVGLSALLLLIFNPIKRENDIVRFFLISFGFHLLVAFAGFTTKNNSINAFWQFNRRLFLRILAAALYSGVLYLGLCAAIGAMNFLFGFDFEEDTFQILAVWIFIMFQTLFFLAEVPLNFSELDKDHTYPSGLKLFTQYVLIPLATVYLLILLSYEIKILMEWNVPKGLVSLLILGYAVFGTLSLLLVYPLRTHDEHRWIKTYAKSFYYLLIPLLVLLYLAVFQRVTNYGITEERYFLIALALWLTFITGYFVIAGYQNIKLIPISLCIVSLLAVYGPMSAFEVSERSQLSELKEILEKNELIKSGKMTPITSKLDSAENERLIDVSKYIISKYGLESLQPIIKENLSQVKDSIDRKLRSKKDGRSSYNRWSLQEAEQKWLVKNYKIPSYHYEATPSEYYTVEAVNSGLIPLKSADYLIEISRYQREPIIVQLDESRKLRYKVIDNTLTVLIEKDSIKLDLKNLMYRIDREVTKRKPTAKSETDPMTDTETVGKADIFLPRETLSEQFNLNQYQITILFNNLRYNSTNENKDLEYFNGVMLLKKSN